MSEAQVKENEKHLDDIDDILDQTIDELADYVPFVPFPLGDYKCQFGYETAEIGDSNLPAVRVNFTLKEVISMVAANAEAPEEGRKISLVYILKKKDGERNTVGEGQLKSQILLPLRETFGGEKASEIFNNADGCEVICTFGQRKRRNKDTNEVFIENVLKAMVVDA